MIPTKHIHRAQSNPQLNLISVISQPSKSRKSKKERKESQKRKSKKFVPMQRAKSSNIYEIDNYDQEERINEHEQEIMKHIKTERRAGTSSVSGTSARRYAQRTKSLTSFNRKKTKHKRSSSKGNPKQSDYKNKKNSEPCYVIQAHFKNNILAITVYDSSSSNEWRQEFTQNAFKHVQIYKVAKVLIHSIQQTANNNNGNDDEKKHDEMRKQIKIFEYNNFCYVTLLNSNLPSFALRPNNGKNGNKKKKRKNHKDIDVLQEEDEDDDDDDDDQLLSNGSQRIDSLENMMQSPPSLNGMTVTNMIKSTSKSRSPSVASRRKKKKRSRHSTGNIEKREKKLKDRKKTKEAKEKELLYTRHLLEDVSSNGSHSRSHSHGSHSRGSHSRSPRNSIHNIVPSPSPSPSPIPSPSPSPLPFMQHPSYPQYPYITNDDDNKTNKNGQKSIKIALNGNYLTNTNQNMNQQHNTNYINQMPQSYHINNHHHHHNNNHNHHHNHNIFNPHPSPHPSSHHSPSYHSSSYHSPQHTLNNGYGYNNHHHHHHHHNGYNINSVSINTTPKKQKRQKWSNPANFNGYNANNNNYNMNNNINNNEFIGGYRKESGDTLYSNTSYISSSPSAGQVNSGITSISFDSMSTLSPTQISHKSQKIIDKGPGFNDDDNNNNDNDDENEKSLSSKIIDGDYYKDKTMADKDHIKYDFV